MAQLIRRSAAVHKSLPAATSAARHLASASTSPITVDTSLPFTGHKIDPPSRSVETTPKELLGFFRDMAIMRRMEIAADSLYKAKLIRGFCHLYDGQEAVAVGMEAAISKKDCIITVYRDRCIFHTRGGTLLEMFSEPLFEALNMAALWDLPAILVCENNPYGMGTAEWRAAKSPAYYKRGDYVPGLKILEMDTYRYHGHSMSDPRSTYRTRDEKSGIRQERDPIERIRKLILTRDIASEEELEILEKELRQEVDEAILQAKESPMPDPSELFTNVYVKGLGTESFGADRKEVRVQLP